MGICGMRREMGWCVRCEQSVFALRRWSIRSCGSNGVQRGNLVCTRDDSSVAEQRPRYGTEMGASGSFYDVRVRVEAV